MPSGVGEGRVENERGEIPTEVFAEAASGTIEEEEEYDDVDEANVEEG